MAYADQKMSQGKIVAIVIVALIHAALGYAFVTGLAYQYVKKAQEKLNTFDVEEPPPPPPDQPMTPPPVVSPPPIVQNPNPPPVVIATVPNPPPVFIPTPVAAAPAPQPAPAPAPSVVSKSASAKGDESQWITVDDYPASSLRAGEQGTTGIAWTITAQGRVENCHTTQSSGSSALDAAACRALTRRARYSPALDQGGNPMSTTKSRRVVWKVPNE